MLHLSRFPDGNAFNGREHSGANQSTDDLGNCCEIGARLKMEPQMSKYGNASKGDLGRD